jgi:hypothetical protein
VPEGDEIRDLRTHIDAAHAAADKLVREAKERAERSDRAFRERLGNVPERGWDVPAEHRPAERPSELQVIVNLLSTLRDAIPEELSQQLAEAVRELLLAVRALIDWYLDRLERLPRPTGKGGGDDRVEDIPIS